MVFPAGEVWLRAKRLPAGLYGSATELVLGGVAVLCCAVIGRTSSAAAGDVWHKCAQTLSMRLLLCMDWTQDYDLWIEGHFSHTVGASVSQRTATHSTHTFVTVLNSSTAW
eukprot:CAMPEP_0174330760 /NCGR_PEP_ID=MMETSP0810-20121108/16926_1 /TAXON_ID=73025 ORGANISM="Eutreptiella gymnastica-like, Strain CCMP1594" /NCGR_SAMPLE_ID=MMETSP0810 /ASSEMBLY_ACC=CAM_ASM_000659 /LENGTH=110 /DNA_ID=CAMNT_0015446103 /DNA_START=532 /DNA_END=861 /DNA_ORIENTATION=-